MSTKTKFIFDVFGIGELKVRQRKFHEQIYHINKSKTVIYESFTSWSQPCTFELASSGVLYLDNFRFSINDIEYRNYDVIKEIVDGRVLDNKGRFIPIALNNSTALLRILTCIVHKHPI